jgi:hypothetical protein
MRGLLVNFSDLALAKEWGPREMRELQRNFDNLVKESEELQAELDKLPPKHKERLLKEWGGPTWIDPQYRPWGGLFPPKKDEP